jgi:hypothetical protein
MPALPLRIAVLECDTPLPQTKDKYAGYGGVFESLLRRGARTFGPQVLDAQNDLIVTKHHIVDDREGDASWETNYPDLEEIDGILITGSRKFSLAPFQY